MIRLPILIAVDILPVWILCINGVDLPTSTSCMGIIIVFNVITEKEEVPQVVLIRALEPLLGLELWLSIEE